MQLQAQPPCVPMIMNQPYGKLKEVSSIVFDDMPLNIICGNFICIIMMKKGEFIFNLYEYMSIKYITYRGCQFWIK